MNSPKKPANLESKSGRVDLVQQVSFKLAALLLHKHLEKGGGLEIPSLGISISKRDKSLEKKEN